MAPDPRPYHHGDLRRALLDAAVVVLTESGPARLSLREVARRTGVSHAAPAHHFGDKAGLLTAVATEGYRLQAAALAEAYERTGDFLEVGVAYVGFAITHRAHFDVMYRPDLHHRDDPELSAARAAAGELLHGPSRELPGRAGQRAADAAIAAWSLVHGLATLWLNGNLPGIGDNPEAATRRAAAFLFRASV